MSHIDEGELTAYADGAYAPDDPVAHSIAAHLAECANCRNRLAAVSALSARAAEVLAVASPAAVSAPAFEQIQQAARVAPRRRSFVPAAWAASIILALGLGWAAHGLLQQPEARLANAPEVAPAPSAPLAVAPSAPARESVAVPAPVARIAAAETRATKVTGKPAAVPSEQPAAGQVASDAVVAPPAPSLAQAAVETHVIAGLDVVATRIVGDSLIVEQKLPDGTIVTLTSTEQPQMEAQAFRANAAGKQAAPVAAERAQRSVAAAAPPPAAISPTKTVVVSRGTRRIVVRGPLSEDSLRVLAEKIR